MTVKQEMSEKIRVALKALSVGDAFGFKLSTRPRHVERRELPEGPWYWSDDTAMASTLAAVLLHHGELGQDLLFEQFVKRYELQPWRGYGTGMKRLLGRYGGSDWRESTTKLFSGTGSFGNGAAMRVAPVGIYFADDLAAVADHAAASAVVTHAHDEGIAGAVAVASAAALAAQRRDLSAEELIRGVVQNTPASDVRDGIERSLDFAPEDLSVAAEVLGNGYRITAQDTVPLCVWWAAHNLDNFEDAMWRLVGVGGDEDTNCAIVGGILGASGAVAPSEWQRSTEALPELVLL